MAKSDQKQILVYADWENFKQPIFMGTLAVTQARGKEVFSFEYDEDWLSNQTAHYLDPNLGMFKGRQYLPDDKSNFGIFLDSSPDRWGRVLMKRREALEAREEGRKEKTFFESDFVLGVYDKHRMGALRFKLNEEGIFLNDNKAFATPPWAALKDLEYASMKLEDDDNDDAESLQWLNMLIAPGSSLGGARPKASIVDKKGNLWIAKFPSKNDAKDIGAWEIVTHQLAINAGLNVPEAGVQIFSGNHHTFLSKRFDRKKEQRIHFASAMTLLGYKDGEDHTTGVSYLALVGFIQQFGGNVDSDLEELWRRIVFNICVSNTDDHLRNHGFLLTEKGWILAPAYDMNPEEKGAGLSLNISETDNSLNLEVAKEVAEYFRLKKDKAETIITKVVSSVKQWKAVPAKEGISKNKIQSMEKAFCHF